MLVGKGFQYFKLFYIVFLYFMIVVFMYLKKKLYDFLLKFFVYQEYKDEILYLGRKGKKLFCIYILIIFLNFYEYKIF